MIAVILAGGRGTRISSAFPGIPKALVPVGGVPVIVRQIERLRSEGIKDFIVVTGFEADSIESYVGNGSIFGVNIRYYREEVPLGTAGSLFRLGLEEDFLLVNSDLVFDFDLASMQSFHVEKHALATVFTHPNTHPADSILIEKNSESVITRFIPKEERSGYYSNLCCAGIEIISPELLLSFSPPEYADLDRDILIPCVKTHRLYAYKSTEYVKDMGTPERLEETGRDLLNGIPSKKRKNNPQKAVFLDRDGTLNVYKPFISSADDLTLLPGVGEAVRLINKLGYAAVVITNQPVVARGECTFSELTEIHCKLETLLGEYGAYLDAIYVCPHHPVGGFSGEISELKKECSCRKPKPGLIFRAAGEMNIDVKNSYMVGDTVRDVLTAVNAGCKPVFLADDNNGIQMTDNAGPSLSELDAGIKQQDVLTFPDLYSFALTLPCI